MGADSRVINATVEIETIDSITDMARQERRSFSSMIEILLIEAVEARNLLNGRHRHIEKLVKQH